jgi:asparagine synthetase B (glutamine-hydrolysing)
MSNDNYERVLAVETKTLKNDWVASYGDIEANQPGRINRADNWLQNKWASEPGKKLRLFGNAADVSVAELKTPGIRVIFFGQIYDLEREVVDHRVEGEIEATDAAPAYILKAYLKRGEGFIRNLKGIYSLVIWDSQREILLALRDRIGNIPLFYSENSREFLLSISMDAILAQPGMDRAVNRVAVAEFLCDRWIQPQETYQANIRRILPGHALRYSKIGIEHFRYWEPILPDQKIEWITEREAHQFDDLLSQAVARCVDNRAVGIFLSGGLDSVTVATLATDLSRKQSFTSPSAYSLIFPYPGASEEDIQRSVAEKLNIPHFIISLLDTISPGGFLKSAIGISDTRPVPLLNLWAPGYQYLTMKVGESGIQTILTGGGGDEWLGVSPYYSADLIRAFELRKFFDYLTYVKDSFHYSTLRLFQNVIWKFGIRPVLGRYVGEFLRQVSPETLRRHRIRLNTHAIPDWLAPDPLLRQEMAQRYDEHITETINKEAPDSMYVNEVIQSLDHPLVSMEYEEAFEGARRFGIKKLAPFQDFELAEFLIRTPPPLLNKGKKSKGLVRGLLAERFPELGFDTQKKRAGTPFFRDTLIREGGAFWDELGGTPTLSALGVVDKTRMDEYIHQIFQAEVPSHHSWFIWHSLCMDSWSYQNS